MFMILPNIGREMTVLKILIHFPVCLEYLGIWQVTHLISVKYDILNLLANNSYGEHIFEDSK